MASDDGKHSDTNKNRPAKKTDLGKKVAKEVGDAVKTAKESQDNGTSK